MIFAVAWLYVWGVVFTRWAVVNESKTLDGSGVISLLWPFVVPVIWIHTIWKVRK